MTLGVNAATQDRKKDGMMYSISGMKLKEAPAFYTTLDEVMEKE